MEIDVPLDDVNSNIPLLISLPMMISMGMVIDTKNQTVEIDGITTKLIMNVAGHYVFQISKWAEDNCQVVRVS